MIFRIALKNMLSSLSKWAISKHKIQIYVVSGWHGTELARELAYQVLGAKLVVRRMTKNPWWDLSIPLAILGYQDHRRNPIAWAWLMSKATLRLIFGKANPHILILNINYSDADTAKYWASFLKPSVLLITAFKEALPFLQKIIKITKDAGGWIVCDDYDKAEVTNIVGDYAKIFSFGSEGGKLLFKEKADNVVVFGFEKKEYRVKKGFMPGIKPEMLAGCLSLALVNKIAIVDALYSLIKFQMPSRMIQKLKLDLKS
jgi:hypothetical protein